MLQADLYTCLTDDILAKVDRMSMAHSLEVRSPLLDEVMPLWPVPRAFKYTEWNSKVLLRVWLSATAPDDFKPAQTGFAIPLGAWIRGPLRPWVYDVLCSERATNAVCFLQTCARW